MPELRGSIEVRPPDDNTAQDVVEARYTVAYLAVYRLIEKYGFDRAMAFYDKVVRDGVEAELAALPALGVPWAEVERDCADYVRRTVS